MFWINVPFGLAGIVGTAIVVRESRNPHSRRLDVLGVLLSAAGLVAATLGLVESASHAWSSARVLVPLALGVVLLVVFALWQRRTPHAMVPPQLLRARGFAVAAIVYLISYMALSATLFYVSLFYQGVAGWSVLRTGLSWLFMNIPFLTAAQLAGRLERRFTPTAVVATGCLVAAAGLAAIAAAGPATPFALTAAGYVLSGAGFGALVPAVTHLAMRDVPGGTSGVASAVLNASRQIGTSMGLAVLGAIGVSAIIAHWRAGVERLPTAARAAAREQAQHVAGARISEVVRAIGPEYRQSAAQSFAHGYHLAVGGGAGCLVVAAVITILGLRRSRQAIAPAHQSG